MRLRTQLDGLQNKDLVLLFSRLSGNAHLLEPR
jgi:hypothetical protein